MANAHNILVSVGANTTSFERSMNNMERSMGSINTATQAMKTKMTEAFKAQDIAMQPLKQRMMEQKLGWMEMADGMSTYSGTNAQFITDVQAMGKADKAIKDQMMASNDAMKAGFITGVGAMLARSTTSSKIAENFDRINNPLYRVNNGLLKITGGLEGIAKGGQPAVMALKMLGPTANMKQLADQTRLISTGMMRFQSVAIVAGIATTLMVGALHKSAMENEDYANSFNTMISKVKEAFQPMVDVFIAVMPKIYDVITAIAEMAIQFNEAHPFLAKLIQGFLMIIPILVLILSPLAIGIGLFNGMSVAFASLAPLIMPLITGLGAMMGTVLLVAGAIVALIAVGVLLYKNWDTIVAWLKKAWKAIKETAINVFNGLIDFFKKWGTTILAVLTGPIGLIVLYVSRNWDEIKAKTLAIWNSIKQKTSEIWNGIKDFFTKWGTAILTVLTTAIGLVVTSVTKKWDSIKTTTSTVFNAIKTTAGTIWKGIKTAIVTPIEEAKGKVKSIVDAIKGFFTNMKLKIPKFGMPKLPHFSLSGKFSLNPPSVPKLGVNWYAKGGVFNGASVVGVGEAGTEAVVPLQGNRMKPFAREIAGQMPQAINGGGNGFGGDIVITLDGREIARATAPHMNSELRGKRDSTSRAGGRF